MPDLVALTAPYRETFLLVLFRVSGMMAAAPVSDATGAISPENWMVGRMVRIVAATIAAICERVNAEITSPSPVAAQA